MRSLGNIFVWLGLLIAAVSGLVVTKEMLTRHPLGFLAFWAFIPVVSWWLTWGNPRDSLSSVRYFKDKSLKIFRAFLVGAAFLLSLLIFLNWEEIRDGVGKHYVQGYVVTHDVEITENGSQRTSTVYTDHWYTERALWLFELLLVAGSFGFPLLTLTLTQRAVALHRESMDYDREVNSAPKILLLVWQENEGIARTFHLLLTNWGCSVTLVSSISEAKKQLESVSYDLAIFDLCDPAVELEPDKLLQLHNKVLFLTCGHETHSLLVPSGYTAVIQKPVEPEELSRKLQEMLKGRGKAEAIAQ